MSSPQTVSAIPVAESVLSRPEVAVRTLERAVRGSPKDANILYLLAMAHKRQGNTREARNVLRKIEMDANVLFQLGLLSLADKNQAQAEAEFALSWEADSTCYETCYNLLLTKLSLGKIEEAVELIPQAIELASRQQGAEETVRFLTLLQALLEVSRTMDQGRPLSLVLSSITGQEEQALLRLVQGLGQLNVIHRLLMTLAEAKPKSMPIREVYVEVALLKAKDLADRCEWGEAEAILRPLSREQAMGRSFQLVVLNLLGCCSAMLQDFDGAIRSFQAGLKLAPHDLRLHQNLALAQELQGGLSEADPHWNRYFDLLGGRLPGPPGVPDYTERLAYEGLQRLAASYTENQRWNSALAYAQRAAHLRPNDPDTLEKLFQLFVSAKRHQEARRILEQLRQLRPNDPQFDLYELDMIDVRGLNDIEKLLTEIDKILRRHPGDVRVEERAVSMVGNVIPLMGDLCDQLTDQMSKVIDQVRHLPNYRIDWTAVREVMRDLLKEFQKLRRITGKCLPLVTSDEHKRIVRDLADHIDRKMEACRSMGA
jgi:tetratricopeptide (TPR) repeat protein